VSFANGLTGGLPAGGAATTVGSLGVVGGDHLFDAVDST
jgi:hypothetical protein